MSQEGNENTNQTDQASAQAVNAQEGGSESTPQVPTTISSLNNYRAKQQQRAAQNHFGQVGSPQQSGQDQSEGATEPNVGESQTQQRDSREQWIPRDRFDQVIQQKQQLEQQFQQAQQAQQFQQQVTGMQGPQQQQFQPQPQQVQGQTGMMHPVPQQQQAQPQQQQPEMPNFDDPEVQKEWKRKINNDPIGGLREFMRIMVQAEGQPLLQQYVQQINSQLTPLQRAFVNQQVQQYSQQKSNDPQFQQIAPTFNQLVSTAQQRGYDVTNPQVLQTIEFVARQQSGLPPQGQAQGQQAEPMPFSERPGNSGANLGRSQQYRQLSPQEQRIAQRFGQTPQQYLESLRAMGAE